MSHLLTFIPDRRPSTVEVASELRQIAEAWSESVAAHLTSQSLASSPLRLKREPVQLAVHDGRFFAAVRRQERLGELINILATVVRSADALAHLAATVSGTVVACNPTTSSVGHDVEVVDDHGTHWIVEVSDVAGRGNANGKMTKDLVTLLGAPVDARLLLAVSPPSAAWLTSPSASTPQRLGARCRAVATLGDDPDVATHIVAVERIPSDD